jgi:hypothetical protein
VQTPHSRHVEGGRGEQKLTGRKVPDEERAQARQADVKRAIEAAEQAGLKSYCVEVAPDGTIAIVVGPPEDTAKPA